MQVRDAINRAKEVLPGLMNRELSGVTGVAKTEEGWRVDLEVVERKAVPDTQDVLGVYEVSLDDSGQVKGYARTRVRRRMDLEEVVG
jgi:hypothetical protein